jgi:Flp pilus assembly protein TadB
LSVKTLSAPWLIRLNWDELTTLLVCVSLDLLEYTLPMLMMPLAGDVVDFIGVLFCVFYFSWVGFLSLFELLPGLDVLPCFTTTWLVWYLRRRRNAQLKIEEELEKWR